MKANWRLYREVLSILPPTARRFLLVYAVLQGLLAILDGAALALLAVVLSPLISGTPVELPVFGRVEGAGALVPVVVVCVIIVVKGVLALLLYWAATRRFWRSGADIRAGDRASYWRCCGARTPRGIGQPPVR